MSYPTVVFAHFNDKNFELLQRIPGYLDISTFDMILHYLFEEHYLKTPWDEYQKIYQSKNPALQASQKIEMANILVTGASGFLGWHFCRLFS